MTQLTRRDSRMLQDIENYALENFTVEAWDILVDAYFDREELNEIIQKTDTLEQAIDVLVPLLDSWMEKSARRDEKIRRNTCI